MSLFVIRFLYFFHRVIHERNLFHLMGYIRSTYWFHNACLPVRASFRFDGIGRNILTFHTKKGVGKLIFGIDVTKWCMFRNIS